LSLIVIHTVRYRLSPYPFSHRHAYHLPRPQISNQRTFCILETTGKPSRHKQTSFRDDRRTKRIHYKLDTSKR
jgi:hypothetical protein